MKNETLQQKMLYGKTLHGGNPTMEQLALNAGNNTPEIQYDFSVNLNPLGMPEEIEKILLGISTSTFSNYPEPFAEKAVKALAESLKLNYERVILGNGATEIFAWIIQALKPTSAAFIAPCYTGYEDVCIAYSIPYEYVPATRSRNAFKSDFSFLESAHYDMVFFGHPNNPTGDCLNSRKHILKIIEKFPETFFVADESFIDFMPDTQEKSLISIENIPGNLIIVRSLTKFFSIAGIRIGFATASDKTIQKLKKVILPWTVNAIAQSVSPYLYSQTDFISKSKKIVSRLRSDFAKKLENIGCKVFLGQVNFILSELPNGISGSKLQKQLFEHGVFIRRCANFAYLDDSYIRLAVRSENENNILIELISSIIKEKDTQNLSAKDKNTEKKYRNIMVVGTTSNSGKSFFTAALCRYFKRKGIRTAPFKAQNMSLNSFVTPEGGEIGRAQAVQAKAAKILPHSDMNPILIKPSGEKGSQIIVNGYPKFNLVTAKDYYEEKNDLKYDAFKAFDRLAKRFDLIILEGAGSPAEINLLDKDFVNMAMAEYAGASVILIADIDRGGVFASIYGTVKLLPQKYRKLIKGIVINKFRGDPSLLTPAIKDIQQLTGIPVIGVIPYLRDIKIEDEDSLCLETKKQNNIPADSKNIIDIVIIKLPHISNFTDFAAMEDMPKVSIRYIDSPQYIGTPDLIIIPGTKNTSADMRFLWKSLLADTIISLHKNKNTPVFGICGGFQMLGEQIKDPYHIEGETTAVKGLGLLPIHTIITKTKTLRQINGVFRDDTPFAKKDTPFTGYEIHMGKTQITNNNQIIIPIVISEDEHPEADGNKYCISAATACSKAFGTYIHGIFDTAEIRIQLLQWLARQKNMNPQIITQIINNDPDNAFEQLADMIEKHIQVDKII